jgi:hypothetical protein
MVANRAWLEALTSIDVQALLAGHTGEAWVRIIKVIRDCEVDGKNLSEHMESPARLAEFFRDELDHVMNAFVAKQLYKTLTEAGEGSSAPPGGAGGGAGGAAAAAPTIAYAHSQRQYVAGVEAVVVLPGSHQSHQLQQFQHQGAYATAPSLPPPQSVEHVYAQQEELPQAQFWSPSAVATTGGGGVSGGAGGGGYAVSPPAHQYPPPGPMPLMNRSGAAMSPGRDGKLLYCGRVLGTQVIPGSDGRCGPTNGPQCPDCKAGPVVLGAAAAAAAVPAGAPAFAAVAARVVHQCNRAGAVMKSGQGACAGTLYCGRVLGKAAIPGSDGRCGPTNGPQCPDCKAGPLASVMASPPPPQIVIATAAAVNHRFNRAGAVMSPGQGACASALYCGRVLGKVAIPGSDGRCGPTNGPQCPDCKAGPVSLVAPAVVSQASAASAAALAVPRGPEVVHQFNRAGAIMSRGQESGVNTLYCGRVLGKAAIPGSDGRCGPTNGPQCPDCRAGPVVNYY